MNSSSFGLVVPCYNYGAGLARSLDRIASWRQQSKLNFRLCVINDGSTDQSIEIARTFAQNNQDWCVARALPVNRGKGAAIRAGVDFLGADLRYIFFTDSDLHYGLEVISQRMLGILEQGADVVMLDRSWNREFHSKSKLRKALSYGFIHLKTVLAGVPFEDSQAGLKGFRGDFLRAASAVTRIDGFAFDVEILAIALNHRFRVEQVPIALAGEAGSEGSSVTPRKAVRMLWDLVRIAYGRYVGRYEAKYFFERIAQQVYEIKK